MPEIIHAEQLRKTYRVGKVDVPALRGVDLSVEQGEFVSIVGPSGCGKSSLLHIIGGLTQPSGGQLTVDGDDLAQMSEAQRTEMRKKKIGFVFQRFNLLPTLSAYDNIALASHIAGPIPGHASQHKGGVDKEHLQAILKLLGIDQRINHRPLEMSGGEQQRVAIARAVVNKPKILLADEPTGALDTETSQLVLNMLQELNGKFGQTILMITHNPEVAAFSDRIITMRDGHVIDDGRE